MTEITDVEIREGKGGIGLYGINVFWQREGQLYGLPVQTLAKAERLKTNLEAGMEPSRAVQDALAPKSPTRAQFARSGAVALNAKRTPEQRRRAALKAVRARWAAVAAAKKGGKK